VKVLGAIVLVLVAASVALWRDVFTLMDLYGFGRPLETMLLGLGLFGLLFGPWVVVLRTIVRPHAWPPP